MYFIDIIRMEKIKAILEDHFINDTSISVLFNFTIDEINISKFICLQNMLSNIFLNDIKKNEIMNIFCNIQKFIHAIYRLKYVWKLKRAIVYNTDDLYMNPIHIGQKNTLVLLQNNTKYIFQIKELIVSMNTYLSNSCYFFTDPLVCKNPYTNIPFDKAALYNIYFAIRDSTFIMPSLLHEYFLLDFNLSDFSITNQHMMNKEYLRTYVNNNCAQYVYEHVIDMFNYYQIANKIHSKFPNDKLFTIMKPYLDLYYMANYSLNQYKKRLYYKTLYKKLREFIKFNPTFGRKKVHLIQVTPFSKYKKLEIYFDDKHIPFYESKNCVVYTKSFMKSHLNNKEIINTMNVRTISQMNDISDDSDESVYNDNNDSDNDSDNDESSYVEADSEDEENEENTTNENNNIYENEMTNNDSDSDNSIILENSENENEDE